MTDGGGNVFNAGQFNDQAVGLQRAGDFHSRLADAEKVYPFFNNVAQSVRHRLALGGINVGHVNFVNEMRPSHQIKAEPPGKMRSAQPFGINKNGGRGR